MSLDSSIGPRADNPSSPLEFLSVLTLNTWNREGPWEERREVLRSWFARLLPDVMGLQEVQDLAQAEDLLGDLEYHIEWAGNEKSGIAIAARWPIRERAELWLTGDGNAPGGLALRGLVDAPIGQLAFTCATTFFFMTHHGWKRQRQMPGLSKFARGAATNFPPIMVGDFNTDPESAEIRFLKGLQSLNGRSAYFCDAWEFAGDGSRGTTWSNFNDHARVWHWPDRRLDYIFVGPPLLDGTGVIESCEVVCNESSNGVWPSDHFGVFASLHAQPVPTGARAERAK